MMDPCNVITKEKWLRLVSMLFWIVECTHEAGGLFYDWFEASLCQMSNGMRLGISHVMVSRLYKHGGLRV